MIENFNEYEPIFMDNSFDTFSLNNCGRNPYISSLFPFHSIDEHYSIRGINCQNNNSESAIFFPKDNNTINTNITTGIKNNDFNKPTVPKKTNLGRKRKDESGFGGHTKYSEDNIIKKIKTYFMKYLDKILNDSVRFAYKKFYKLNPKISGNLKRDYNIRLMNTTIRKIYEENLPWRKNDPSVKDKNYNLIQEIFYNNDYTKTIEILNTKYIDLIKTLKAKEYICKEIQKHIKEPDDKIAYMSKLRNLLEHFDEWFTKKHERKYKSKQNENNGIIKNN